MECGACKDEAHFLFRDVGFCKYHAEEVLKMKDEPLLAREIYVEYLVQTKDKKR